MGLHTVVELQNKDFEVVIIDDLSNSSEEDIKRNSQCLKMGIEK